MGIGVEEAVHHHHPQVESGQALHHVLEAQLPGGEAIVEPVHLRAPQVLHDQDPAGGQGLHDQGDPDLRVPAERLPEAFHVLRLLPEVHLLPHPHGELANHVRDPPDVVVGEEDVEPEEDPEGEIQVQGHHLLHSRAEDLHHHLPALVPGPVDLSQGGGGHRRIVRKSSKHLRHGSAQLRLHHGPSGFGGDGRHLVLEGSQGREIGLRNQIRPGAEDLGQLDEGGTHLRDGGDEPPGPSLVLIRTSAGGSAQEKEPLPIPQEAEDEGKEADEDPHSPEKPPHLAPASDEASPRAPSSHPTMTWVTRSSWIL
jgi:hypothetical protein